MTDEVADNLPMEQTVASVYAEQNTAKTTEIYVLCVMLIILAVLGSTGNGVVLYVFARRRDRLVSTLYIEVLAVVDLFASLFLMPFTAYMEYVDFHIDSEINCKLYMFLITSNIPFSALIMVAIAVDRYLCICYPFAGLLTLRRAKVLLAILTVFVTIMGICVSLQHGTYQLNNASSPMVASSEYLFTSDFEPTSVSTPNDDRLFDKSSKSPSIRNAINAGSAIESAVVESAVVKSAVSDVIDESKTMRMITLSALSDQRTRQLDGTDQLPTTSLLKNNKIVNLEGLEHTGQCRLTNTVFGENFQKYFQKFHTTLFLICLLVVTVLYVLIYRSVAKRRTRRQREKFKRVSTASVMTTMSMSAMYMPAIGRKRSEKQCPLRLQKLTSGGEHSKQSVNERVYLHKECISCLECIDPVVTTITMRNSGEDDSKQSDQRTERRSSSTNIDDMLSIQERGQTLNQPHRLLCVPMTSTSCSDSLQPPVSTFPDPSCASPCRSRWPSNTDAALPSRRSTSPAPHNARRTRRRSSNGSGRTGDGSCGSGKEQTTSTHSIGVSGRKWSGWRSNGRPSRAESLRSLRADAKFMANLRTAVMLFVVTVVFVISFAPALFISLQLVPYNILVFYMYFINNIANPVIYSFMNKNFRDDLARLFCSVVQR